MFWFAVDYLSYPFYTGIGYIRWLTSSRKSAEPSPEKKQSSSVISSSPCWHFKEGNWVMMEKIPSGPAPIKGNLTVATFNLLMNDVKWMDWVCRTEERWKYQLDEMLPQLNADVIGLNEVCAEYIELLKQRKWIQENYILSHLDKSLFHPRGNVIMCKKELAKGFFREETSQAKVRSTAIAEIEFLTGSNEKKTILLSSVHFCAYEEYTAFREIELRNLTSALDKFGENKPLSGMMILGDFNFHSEDENKNIPETWTDIWTSVWKNSGDETKEKGYTYNSVENKMISILYPPERRNMRLDRVIWKQSLQDHKPQFTIDMFANKPVPNASQSYIFPSDHYGLITTLQYPTLSNL